MEPINHDLVLFQGKDWARVISLPDITESAVSARMTVRTRILGAVIVELTTENGRIDISQVDGTVNLSISAQTSTDFDLVGMVSRTVLEGFDDSGRPLKATGPTGVYDIEVIDDANIVSGVYTGQFCIGQEATSI